MNFWLIYNAVAREESIISLTKIANYVYGKTKVPM